MQLTSLIRGTAVLMVSLMAVPVLAGNQAPTGTYTATTGSSAATASGGGRSGGGPRAGGGAGRGRTGTTSTSAGSGSDLTMDVASWSTQADAQQLTSAQGGNGQGALAVLNSMNHGSVTIAGRNFPINAAFSVPKGSGYSIYLVSAKPFSAEGGRGRAAGATSGLIVLHVDASGAGTGELYTSTQVVFETTGEVQARGGASTATNLSGVAHL